MSKSFKQLINENNIIRKLEQNDWSEPSEEIRAYIKRNGNKVLGVFGTKANYKAKNYSERYILELFDNEKSSYKILIDDKDEIICRYVSQTTVASNQAPLIKLNLNKGLVHFLKDYDADDINDYEFDKGQKLEYIRTVL